jgi:hypothetical protein
MSKNTPLFITDDHGNAVASLETVDHTIKFSDILLKVSQTSESRMRDLERRIVDLETDLKDQKEAFEHTDDSLANLRKTVAELQEDHNGHE